MYNYLKGRVVCVDDFTLDVNGIGYQINPSQSLLGSVKIDEVVTVFTYLEVKENSHSLFGFETTSERELFKLLLNVNGVGAKSALSFLALGMPTLVSAIGSGNTAVLSRVKGVGEKLATKVVLELRTKIAKKFITQETVLTQEHVASSEVIDALAGLVSLGMPRLRAQEILASLDSAGKTAEELVVMALGKKI